MRVVIENSIFWFAFYVASKWACFHWLNVKNRHMIASKLFLATVAACSISIVILIDFSQNYWLIFYYVSCGIISLACYYVLYTPFYYTVCTSLSIQSLIRLQQCGGTLNENDLLKEFASLDLIHKRLEIMSTNKYIVRSGDHYTATRKGRFVAAVFSNLKRLWNLGAGG